MTISYLQLARNVQVGSAGKSRKNPHPHELGNGCWPSYRHRSQFRGMTHTSHTSHKSVGFWPMWSHVCWLRFGDGIEFFWRHPATFLCSAGPFPLQSRLDPHAFQPRGQHVCKGVLSDTGLVSGCGKLMVVESLWAIYKAYVYIYIYMCTCMCIYIYT